MAQDHLTREIHELFRDYVEDMNTSEDICDRICGTEFGRRLIADPDDSKMSRWLLLPEGVGDRMYAERPERVAELRKELTTNGFCVLENALSSHACTTSKDCMNKLGSLAVRGVDPEFKGLFDRLRGLDHLLHEGCFSGRIAWSPDGEMFGVGSGWWAPRLALALFHPRITENVRAIISAGGGDGPRASLPAPAIVSDVPELRARGLATAAKRYAERDHAVGVCGEAERAWVFVQGGRVQVWEAPQAADLGITAKRIRRMSSSSWVAEESKEEEDKAAGEMKFVDVPTGAVLFLARGYVARFTHPCIARVPRDRGLMDDIQTLELEQLLRASGYSAEVSKAHLGKKSAIRQAYKSVFETEDVDGSVYAKSLSPIIALPVGSASISPGMQRFADLCDAQQIPFTCRHETACRGARDIYPRAREFDSTTRTRHLESIDVFLQALNCVLSTKRNPI